MYVIPAIDLMSGSCVRLIQGDYNRRITYDKDPVKQTKRFRSAGAEWVHIVDLDGAKVGRPVNTESIEAIISAGRLKVELGGGIRDERSIRQMLDIGVDRLIIGTKALNDFEWFAEMAAEFSGKIALSLDARGSKVASHAWTKDHPHRLLEFAAKAAGLPLAAIIYTDITRDGMLAGPNIERTRTLAEAVDAPIIAAGGICRAEDIGKLAAIGIEGAIIGRALYEGTIDLKEAIEAAAGG
jgi:phosphoribosylformimino-5-aminoimidazole carboxamide ribotide isomerase